MAVYTYRQVRGVLRKRRDVPPGTFAEILRQMGIDRETFAKLV